tara:strand:- start:11960 stop:12070 length:111 start_codon:yes stop_codon:yes gene_type:complete
MAGGLVLSGSVGRGAWLLPGVAGFHIAYGGYLIFTG